MKKKTIPETEFVEINLHGYKIHIYTDKVRIFNHEKIPMFDFKSIANLKMEYLFMEGFIDRKNKIRIEIVTPADVTDTKVEAPT
jgi:hypothetical protein